MAASLAAADLTVKARVTVFESTPTPSRDLTLYSKGNLIRTEAGDRVTIRNSGTGKTWVIDPAKKEYRELDKNSSLGSVGKSLKNLIRKTSAKVTPTGKSKKLLGQTAKGYIGTGTIEMGLGEGKGPTVQMNFSFEQWAVPKFGSKNITALLGGLDQMELMGDLPAYAPIRKEMAKIKGVTVMSRTTVTTSAQGRQQKRTIISEVVSAKSGSLNSSLFRIPAGYRRVEVRRPVPPTKH